MVDKRQGFRGPLRNYNKSEQTAWINIQSYTSGPTRKQDDSIVA